VELDTSKITNMSAVEFTPLPSKWDRLVWCPSACFPPVLPPSSHSSPPFTGRGGSQGGGRQVQRVLAGGVASIRRPTAGMPAEGGWAVSQLAPARRSPSHSASVRRSAHGWCPASRTDSPGWIEQLGGNLGQQQAPSVCPAGCTVAGCRACSEAPLAREKLVKAGSAGDDALPDPLSTPQLRDESGGARPDVLGSDVL